MTESWNCADCGQDIPFSFGHYVEGSKQKRCEPCHEIRLVQHQVNLLMARVESLRAALPVRTDPTPLFHRSSRADLLLHRAGGAEGNTPAFSLLHDAALELNSIVIDLISHLP